MVHLVNCSSKSFILFLLIFTIFNINTLYLQASSSTFNPKNIEITSTISPFIEAEPGKIITIPLNISNESADTIKCKEIFNLPPTWKSILMPAPYFLNPYQTEVRLFTFLIPAHCLSGEYSACYQLKYFSGEMNDSAFSPHAVNSKKLSEKIFRITVLPIYKLEIMSVPQSNTLYILAGEEYSTEFTLLNTGNAPEQIALTATDSEGFPVSISKKSLFLQPGASQNVQLKIKTPFDLSHVKEERITLMADIINAAKEDRIFYHYHTMQIIPHISGNPDVYHHIPSRLSLEYQQEGKMEVNIYGDGYLKDNSHSKINYALNLNPISSSNSASLEDCDYSMHLITEDNQEYTLALNQFSSTLSPLLRNDFFHRGGIMGNWKNDRYHLSAYYNSDIHEESEPFQSEKGYILSLGGIPFENGWEFDLNYLNTELMAGNSSILPENVSPNEEFFNPHITNIFSLEIKKKDLFSHLFFPDNPLFANSNLELEYAQAQVDHNQSSAFRSRINGQLKSINFAFSTLYTEPDYPGELNDIHYQNIDISTKIGENMTLGWQLKKQKQISSQDLKLSNHFTLYYQNNNNRLFLLYQHSTEEEVFNLKNQNLYQLYYNHQQKHLDFQTCYQLKTIDDTCNNQLNEYQKYYLSADYHPNSRQSYQLSYYSELNSIPDFLQNRELQFSAQFAFNKNNTLSAICSFGQPVLSYDNLNINLSYQHEFTNGFNVELGQVYAYKKETNNPSNDFELSLSPYIGAAYRHQFSNDSTLSFKGQYSLFSKTFSEGIDLFEIAYQIPFGLPLGHKKDIGVIKGKIFFSENPQLSGVKNIIVKCNHLTTITDDQGYFIFQGLKSGEYILQLDQASLPENYITTKKMPIKMIIKKGEKQTVDTGICRKALLQGEITRYDFPSAALTSADSLVKKGGIHHLNIYLRNKDTGEIRNSITDRAGHFIFPDIRPGHWVFSIINLQLPSSYYIENYPKEFILEPGEIRKVKINILPYKRNIKMIEDVHDILKLPNSYIGKINL